MFCHIISWICIDISEDPAAFIIVVDEVGESRILQNVCMLFADHIPENVLMSEI
jgi:hypothetical protein